MKLARTKYFFAALLSWLCLLCLPALCAAKEPAPPMLLANVLSPQIDVTQYWVSEKYDGVRAQWDGQVLRFRSGRIVPAPTWFVRRLPATPLDGELWMGRGTFDKVSAAVRRDEPRDDEWRAITYMIFEAPNAPGTFSERIEHIQQVVAAAQFTQLKAVTQQRVTDRAQLNQLFNAWVKAGAEGAMLHLAQAPYVTGRSDVLLKLKPQLDTEATVIAHIAGRGKYSGKMGALLLQMPNGKTFKLGTGFSDADRANPPPVGAIVTYTYRDVTPNGLPRFASFVRIRNDP